jgi:hypothetical protein
MNQKYINNLLSDLSSLDSQLSIEKSKNRKLIQDLKSIKYMLVGEGVSKTKSFNDKKAMRYNIKNAINYIDIILKEE